MAKFMKQRDHEIVSLEREAETQAEGEAGSMHWVPNEVLTAKKKFNPFVTSDQSKNYKRQFSTLSHIHRKFVSSLLSKTLRQNCNVVQGHYKGQQIGKVVQVYRKKCVIYTEQGQGEKADGTVVITRLKPDKGLKKILNVKPNLSR
ncbi:unnamed protein product [Nyctereutes procyonoides]|uniref:(raccoon dog) hypothetical protein n=1 Tax=Nyctereutes procyonoides TaxID=34880 RepID=A0A811Y4Y6_NYCPR|nr:unnamed protein product [Nyctereutes procyonoides]